MVCGGRDASLPPAYDWPAHLLGVIARLTGKGSTPENPIVLDWDGKEAAPVQHAVAVPVSLVVAVPVPLVVAVPVSLAFTEPRACEWPPERLGSIRRLLKKGSSPEDPIVPDMDGEGQPLVAVRVAPVVAVSVTPVVAVPVASVVAVPVAPVE
jgi:hypothetical protein